MEPPAFVPLLLLNLADAKNPSGTSGRVLCVSCECEKRLFDDQQQAHFEFALCGNAVQAVLIEAEALACVQFVIFTLIANKDCNRMSGGELQMVLIARALINEPKLIILDEPETGLDFHNQILVLNMVERLAHESGISAIMNTHYPTNAMSVADEALMLNRKGEFFYGPAAEILNEENISYSFDVQVLVDELHYQGRSVRSIVPVALREETAV